MNKFEYKILQFKYSLTVHHLNELGSGSWQIVDIDNRQSPHDSNDFKQTLILMREKDE